MENKQEQQKKYPKRGSWRRLTYSGIKIQFYIFLKDVKKAFNKWYGQEVLKIRV